jgi:hypothetical protein
MTKKLLMMSRLRCIKLFDVLRSEHEFHRHAFLTLCALRPVRSAQADSVVGDHVFRIIACAFEPAP